MGEKRSRSEEAGHPVTVWARTTPMADPAVALRLVADGVPWVLHPCAGRATRSGSAHAPEVLDWLRGRARLVDAAAAERLLQRAARKKGVRKDRVPTVVVAELWRSSEGDPLVVFIEADPHPSPERGDPYRPW